MSGVDPVSGEPEFKHTPARARAPPSRVAPAVAVGIGFNRIVIPLGLSLIVRSVGMVNRRPLTVESPSRIDAPRRIRLAVRSWTPRLTCLSGVKGAQQPRRLRAIQTAIGILEQMTHRYRFVRGSTVLVALGALATIGASGSPEAAESAVAVPGAPVEPGDFPSAYSRTIGSVTVLQIRPDIWLLTAGETNTVLEAGPDGAVVVDPGPAAGAAQMIQAIRAITSVPIRYIINTSADPELTGADAAVAAAGLAYLKSQNGRVAPVVMRQNTLLTLLGSGNQDAPNLVAQAFQRSAFNFVINGQAVHVIAQPPGHSNGDAVVQFQRSDVVVTGRIFDDTAFPTIDRSAGGTLQGEVDALNGLVNGVVTGTFPLVGRPAGVWQQAPAVSTVVVPVRGPLCDQQDLVTYRDMVMTVQARLEDLVKQRQSEAQIDAAHPLQGYDTRYVGGGAEAGSAFVRAAYLSLTGGAAKNHE